MEEWIDVVAKQMIKFLPYEAACNYLQHMYKDILTRSFLFIPFHVHT
jgi:hypothetical protein